MERGTDPGVSLPSQRSFLGLDEHVDGPLRLEDSESRTWVVNVD